MRASGSEVCHTHIHIHTIYRGELQTQGTFNYCPDCRLPCHTKCASKKKNAPCNLCRAAKQAKKEKEKESSLNENKRATATNTTRSSAHCTPGSTGDTRGGRKSAPNTTVTKTRAGASSSPLSALPLKTLSTEKGKRRPPLQNSPLGGTLSTASKTPNVKGAIEKRLLPLQNSPLVETLSTKLKALSAEGASSAAISNYANKSMEISTPASNLNNISTDRRTSSIAGGLPNTTKSGEVTPSTESPVYNNIIIPESTLDLFSNILIRSKSSLRRLMPT